MKSHADQMIDQEPPYSEADDESRVDLSNSTRSTAPEAVRVEMEEGAQSMRRAQESVPSVEG